MKTKTTTLLVLLVAACALPCAAQPAFNPDGDALLGGTYYMRQVFYFLSNQGVVAETVNVQGNIAFSGDGNYDFSGSVLDTAVGTKPQLFTTSGSYVISASGEGYISPIYQTGFNGSIVGLVSQGIFIGSIPGTVGCNSMFIAVPVGPTQATNATLKGDYTVAYFDPLFLTSASALPGGDAIFNMSADGNGNIGNISATSYTGTNATSTSLSLSGVTYAFSNGAAQLKFGGKNGSALLAGTDLLYISPDGNFIFGGSYLGYNMFVAW